MPNIPTIPGSARIQTIPIGVKQDAGPTEQRLSAVRGAFQAAGGAVADAAGAVADYEQKKQKAEEVAAFNQASILTRKTTSAFRDSLRNNPNDQQWLENWQQTSNATRQQILADPRVKGPVRVKMMQTLDEWQGTTSAEFQTAADVAGSERRKRIGLLAADEALKDGNEKAATSAIDGLVRTGDMWKEDAEAKKKTFTATIQENQIRVGTASNAWATLQDINAGKFPSVPKQQLASLRVDAERELARQQSAGRDELLARHDAGELLSEDEIKAKEDAHQISPTGAKGVRSAITRENLNEAKDAHDVMMMRASEHDWDQDKNPEDTAREMKDDAAGLPAPLRKSVYDHIDAEMKKAKSAQAAQIRPAEDAVIKRGADAYAKGLFRPATEEDVMKTVPHWFGMGKDTQEPTGEKETKQPSPDAQWELTASDQERASAELNYSRWRDSMRAYFKKNPDASEEDATRYSQSLLAPHVENQVKAAINPPAMKAPPGAAFYSKSTGQWYDKDKNPIK